MVIVLAPVCCVLIGYSLYYLMMQVIAGRMTLGDIVLLASYGGMLANPMAIIGGTWASVQASVAGLRRVHSVLDNLAEPVSDGRGDGLGARVGNLEFNGVAVGYGATTVLSGVTMSMRAGEMVALAGPSGCGKTTLIHSIPRFIEPSAGTIAFDGVDSRAVAPDTIRARMGFVFQNESLFSTSIEDNIRYGSDSASMADVREAAAMAGCGGIYRPASRRLLDDARAARRAPVGRTETANRDRARPASTPGNYRPRRAGCAARSSFGIRSPENADRARARSNRNHRRPSRRHAGRLRQSLFHSRQDDCRRPARMRTCSRPTATTRPTSRRSAAEIPA